MKKHISILIPNGKASVACIEGPYKLFTTSNEFLIQQGKESLFEVCLVGLDNQPKTYDQNFKVYPDCTIHEISKTDLIIIPAVNGNWNEVVEINKDFLPWIIRNYKNNSELASLCVGAFILAATGLLKGKKCSTHWNSINEFRKMYPEVILESEYTIVEDSGIYSSGGGNTFWNLLLYLLEKYAGRELAVTISKYFILDINQNSQAAFFMFSGEKNHDDQEVIAGQQFIEQNYRNKITVEELSEMLGLGRRSLERRFKKATGNTIVEYIHKVKMEVAKKSLETSRKSIGEVMIEVGYADMKAFREVFKKITGISPVDYRAKYNKEDIV